MKIRISRFVVLLIVSMLVGGCGSTSYGLKWVRPWVERNVERTSSPVHMTTTDFHRRQSSLGGQVVQIEGLLVSGTHRAVSPMIQLDHEVYCAFGRRHAHEVQGLRVGQRLVIRGWVDPVDPDGGIIDACMIIN